MRRSTYVIIVVAVAVAVGAVVLSQAARTRADALEVAARAGKAQASEGVESLAAQDATTAAAHFADASVSFAQAQELMGPEWLGNMAGAIPYVGRQYEAAASLVAIGLDGSKAGFEIASLLQESSADSGDDPRGINSMLQSGRGRIRSALAALSAASIRADGLSEEGLIGPLAEQVRSLKTLLREKIPMYERVGPALLLASSLLESEHRILVVSQNSAELRPTGGFAGSYGIIAVGPEGVRLESYKDVYTLPNPPGRVPPPPGARMTRDFQFRDANWWMDYPTSARMMLDMWNDSGQPAVDGIVAIDVVVMRELLELFEPVDVPGFSETFTSENLLERLTYLIEVEFNGGDAKKDVLVALANELEKKVLTAGPKQLPGVASVMTSAAHAKHVQMYFTDPESQAAAVDLLWAGSLMPPPGTTDLLAVSNAMNKPGKTNFAMSKRIDYAVELQEDGSAETTVVLGYKNSGVLAVKEHGVFRNYLRVYRAPGAVLSPADAARANLANDPDDVDLPVVVREFSVGAGSSHTETIVTTQPKAWQSSSAAKDVARYRLFIARQADLEDVPTTVTIAAPPGWRVSQVGARKVASGERLPAAIKAGAVDAQFALVGDVVFDVEFARN